MPPTPQPLPKDIFYSRSTGVDDSGRSPGNYEQPPASRGFGVLTTASAEARELLTSVYGRFTEGFATADLQQAKRL
jgi:hypothetical protein